jgi:hypothetical protein
MDGSHRGGSHRIDAYRVAAAALHTVIFAIGDRMKEQNA